ncbi:MAG: hypothetical protein FJ041_00130 [Candidatus Cloacimonetes bacterium]|nr:hypothetical protein [Candidatus Cloacimonadota bacterium]
MKKILFFLLMLLPILMLNSKMPEPEFLVTNCKYNPKNWELIKTEELPLEDFSKEPEYFLILNDTDLKVKFIDSNSKLIFSKTNLVTEVDFKLMELNELSYRGEIIDFKNGIRKFEYAEHLTLIDPIAKRKVIIDNTGKETMLPERSIAFIGNGALYNGKYYVFYENDYEDEEQLKTDYSIDDSEYYKRYNYFPSGRGIALFNKDGIVFKEFEVPYDGYLSILAFDSDFKFILLKTSKNELSDEPIIGYLLMTTDGKVIKKYSEKDIYVKNPKFSESGDLLIPDNDYLITIIDTSTGEVITSMDSFGTSGCVADKDVGYVIIPNNSNDMKINSKVFVVDYLHKEIIAKIEVSVAGVADAYINGNGTEISFKVYDNETNKPRVMLYKPSN